MFFFILSGKIDIVFFYSLFGVRVLFVEDTFIGFFLMLLEVVLYFEGDKESIFWIWIFEGFYLVLNVGNFFIKWKYLKKKKKSLDDFIGFFYFWNRWCDLYIFDISGLGCDDLFYYV